MFDLDISEREKKVWNLELLLALTAVYGISNAVERGTCSTGCCYHNADL